jgi:F0F1-type ATP synthase assembly protein I
MANVDKELEALEKEIRADSQKSEEKVKNTVKTEKTGSNAAGSAHNELLEFFIGFLLLGGGIYWVLNSFEVSSGFGYGYYSFFGMRITGGVMLIPLLVGIGLLFFCDKKVIGGFVSALGLLVILISLLSSLTFHARYNTLYVYVLMFGMIAAGAGLIIRSLFKKRD